MKIAFYGLGNMGSHMARNLLRAGHDVTVWNRTLSKAEEFRSDNAKIAKSVADATRDADIAVTMLADDHAVAAAVLDPGGIAEHLAPGGLHISMSTIGVELSRRLAAEHTKRGQHYVSAPVFGRPEAAAAAKLFVVAAGDAARDRAGQAGLRGHRPTDFHHRPETRDGKRGEAQRQLPDLIGD
jgi:3-hydroxyisobutyrate dehydrogenase-like beta-hydroxyacid dehydrogenase